MSPRGFWPTHYNRYEWAGTFLALLGSGALVLALLAEWSSFGPGGPPVLGVLAWAAIAGVGWGLLVAGTIVRRRRTVTPVPA